MAIEVLTLAELPASLRRLRKRDREAVVVGIHVTLAIDAHRWIQWSIASSDRVPVDRGFYKRSWRHERTPDGGFLYSTDGVKAGVIEHGRRPAWIPIPPLAEWVRRKLGVRDERKARSIAFAIAITASRKKRPGLSVLSRAHPKIAEAARANIRRALRASNPD